MFQQHLHFLKENIKLPCATTGIEDFPWEERFLFGVGNEKEHKELTLWAISAREEDAPEDVKPIEWMLLTTFRVTNFEEATEKGDKT